MLTADQTVPVRRLRILDRAGTSARCEFPTLVVMRIEFGDLSTIACLRVLAQIRERRNGESDPHRNVFVPDGLLQRASYVWADSCGVKFGNVGLFDLDKGRISDCFSADQSEDSACDDFLIVNVVFAYG